MSKSPAFQFYPKDLLVDTLELSNEEFGAYWRLVSHAWLRDGLPTDERELAKLAQASVPRFRRLWAVIGRFFSTEHRPDGRLSQKRLEEERRKQAQFREQQREAAYKRWDGVRTAVNGNADAMPAHVAPQSRDDALRTPISVLRTPSPDSGPTTDGDSVGGEGPDEAPPRLPFDDWPAEWGPIKAKLDALPFLARHRRWLEDLSWWQTMDEFVTSAPKELDALLVDAVAQAESEGYVPRTKKALRQKLRNLLHIAANIAEREARREAQATRR